MNARGVMLPRRLTICADDFGMAPAIDAAILDLARDGRLAAVSCLCDGPTLPNNAVALVALPVEIGLHLNLTESFGGRSVAAGSVRPLGALIVASYARRLNHARVVAEVRRQFARFAEAMGREPDFVDGHQHVHQLPVIRAALCEVMARRYPGRKPWLRATRLPEVRLGSLRRTFKARLIAALGDRALQRLADATGIHRNGALLGVYDFCGGVEAYRDHLAHWLRQVRDGDLLMCHPANAVTAGDPLGAQRVAEYKVLAAPALARQLVEQDIVVSVLGPAAPDSVTPDPPIRRETAAQNRP